MSTEAAAPEQPATEDHDPATSAAPPPRRRRRRLASIVIAAVVAVAFVAVVVSATGSGTTRAPSVGPLQRLGGGPPVSLVRGRPTAITFFASWCSPCRTELPMIARVARQQAASGSHVTFLGIDGNDDPGSGLAFARASGVTFAVGQDFDSAIAPRFGLNGYPDTVFVDAKGDVAGIVRGPISSATLHDWLARLSTA